MSQKAMRIVIVLAFMAAGFALGWFFERGCSSASVQDTASLAASAPASATQSSTTPVPASASSASEAASSPAAPVSSASSVEGSTSTASSAESTESAASAPSASLDESAEPANGSSASSIDASSASSPESGQGLSPKAELASSASQSSSPASYDVAGSGAATVTVSEDGKYTSKGEVAAYIHEFGHLPSNFVSKTKARKAGWVSSKGNLDDVLPGMSIGGSEFYNNEGQLPDASGRTWTECDIGYKGGYRGSERIVFSNDGLIFYTGDHYNTFEQLY